MPKFARGNSYNGKQSNSNWTGQTRAATVNEVAAGDADQLYVSPLTLAGAIDAIIGPASETNAGIAEIATQAEITTGTDDTRIVSPLKLATRLASPPAIGGTVAGAGTFTNLTVNTLFSYNGGAAGDFIGTSTLVAGTVTIANTSIAATDRIFIQRTAANASTTLGELSYTISAGASFTITSLITGTPGSPQTGDLSSITYFIVRQV